MISRVILGNIHSVEIIKREAGLSAKYLIGVELQPVTVRTFLLRMPGNSNTAGNEKVGRLAHQRFCSTKIGPSILGARLTIVIGNHMKSSPGKCTQCEKEARRALFSLYRAVRFFGY